MNKEIFKKTGEELQQYLAFKRKGFKLPAKKGKGSYTRKEKHKDKEHYNERRCNALS